jgi:hypothetical protein
MNERIKELIKQAGISVDANGFVDPDNWVDEPELKIFAVLIVKECIDLVKEDMHSGYSNSDFSAGYDAALAMAVNNIKEKFGITE